MNRLRNLIVGVTIAVALGSWVTAEQQKPERRPLSGFGIFRSQANEQIRQAITPRAFAPVTSSLDPAVVIIAWDDAERPIAEKLRGVLSPIVEAVASGGKLTKADAARTNQADHAQTFQTWLTESLVKSREGRKLLIFTVHQGESGAAGHRQNVKCPICGSDQHQYCFPLLDLDKVTIQDMPIEDPEITCLKLTNGMCYPPGCCGNEGSSTGGPQPGGGRLMKPGRTVLVFIVGGTPQNFSTEKRALVQAITDGVEEALTLRPRLVIKTKSTPP